MLPQCLTFIFVLQFGGESSHLSPLNAYIAEAHQRFKYVFNGLVEQLLDLFSLRVLVVFVVLAPKRDTERSCELPKSIYGVVPCGVVFVVRS